jgi:hypothetical protein
MAPLCLVVFLFWGNPRIKTPLPSLGATHRTGGFLPFVCVKTEGLGVRAKGWLINSVIRYVNNSFNTSTRHRYKKPVSFFDVDELAIS